MRVRSTAFSPAESWRSTLPDHPAGLTSAQAAQRLAEYGPNEPVSVRRLLDEVPLDGDELEFRQHVQYGGGIRLAAVPADVADADSFEFRDWRASLL
jgi:Cation transporter/ATPase, N-terminus